MGYTLKFAIKDLYLDKPILIIYFLLIRDKCY